MTDLYAGMNYREAIERNAPSQDAERARQAASELSFPESLRSSAMSYRKGVACALAGNLAVAGIIGAVDAVVQPGAQISTPTQVEVVSGTAEPAINLSQPLSVETLAPYIAPKSAASSH